MKYFYDTEFLEGTQKKRWWNIGKQKPTIDLISIGIVCEDGREYYAVNKDFNLKEAWNRYDEKIQHFSGDMRNQFPNGIKYKEYWIRENVLKPIFNDLMKRWREDEEKATQLRTSMDYNPTFQFKYKNLKKLIKKYGKTLEEIQLDLILDVFIEKSELYGYYSAYDHVALSWIFGKMLNLPDNVPMYTRDLKQMLDEQQENRTKTISLLKETGLYDKYKESEIIFPENLKEHPQYPKQENEHNALSDAIFVKNLYHFLNKV